MSTSTADARRRMPRTDAVLAEPRVAAAVATVGRARVKEARRRRAGRARRGEIAPEAVTDDVVASACLGPTAATLRPVINASGVLLHTNLGRAPLSRRRGTPSSPRRAPRTSSSTSRPVNAAVAGPGPWRRWPRPCPTRAACTSRTTARRLSSSPRPRWPPGARSSSPAARWWRSATGSGCRTCWCRPGARLREVGTTNRVHRRDYADAVGPDTGMILKVHPSNFVVSGFTSAVPTAELTGLGAPVVVDIGSGLLAPDPACCPTSPTPRRRCGRARTS